MKKILNGHHTENIIKNRKELLSEGVDILVHNCFTQLSPHGNRM